MEHAANAKPSQIIKQFIDSHLSLSRYTQTQSECEHAMRMFSLRKGETLELKGIVGDDYIFVANGKIAITDDKGVTAYISSHRQHPSPYLIPENDAHITVKSVTDSQFFHIDSEKLDYYLAIDELSMVMSVAEEPIKRRMDVIMSSLPLSQLGIGNIRDAIACMREVNVPPGQYVINECDSGNSYYIIAEGEAEIWQTTDEDEDEPELIATLGPGDGFGEEGVINERYGNSVLMKTDGHLLVLEKNDFERLLSRKMLNKENPDVIKAYIDNGYQMLDVRYEFEQEMYGKINPSVHIPLHQLRNRYSELDPDGKYVIYCKSGNRSQVAAMYLEQRGIKSVSLNGGISSWPFPL